jgi:tetratricopeptide (TPR) repeat protein
MESPSPDPDDSVELVGFGPTLNKEGRVRTSPERIAAAARRRTVRRRLLVGTVLVVIAAGVAAPLLYRQAKVWRAVSLAHGAVDKLNQGQVQEAIASLHAAYMMAPANPEVLRSMCTVLTALDSPSAMKYWGYVLSLPSVTLEDRRGAAACALQQGFYTEAGQIIARLMKDDPRSAASLLVAARYYALAGSPTQAMAYATRAAAADPANMPAALFLAAQELANPYLHQAGVDALLKIADRDDADDDDDSSSRAIEVLAQDPTLSAPEIDRAMARLESRPLRSEAERITDLIFQLERHPDRQEGLLDAAVATHRDVPEADLRQFASWLNSVNQPARVLQLVPRDQALKSRELFLIYLDALGELKRWGDIAALLGKGPVPLEQASIELYLYRCARETGDAEAADIHWRSAQLAASHSPRQSLYLADYAARLGDNERAAALYRQFTRDLVTGRAAYLGLLRVEQGQSTPTLLALLDQMASRWPDDEAVLNDDIYYNLLLNLRVREMEKRAVDQAKANPFSTAHLTNVALAYLRLHHPDWALRVYEHSQIPWKTATPSARAVYAATLSQTGHPAQALAVAASLKPGTLRPEEAALVQGMR